MRLQCINKSSRVCLIRSHFLCQTYVRYTNVYLKPEKVVQKIRNTVGLEICACQTFFRKEFMDNKYSLTDFYLS